MGAILTQVQGGAIQTVSKFSHKINKAQLKYPVKEQELLAGYKVCRHFHSMIYGFNAMIQCDQMNIARAKTQQIKLHVLR